MRFRFSNLPIALLAIVAVASMIKGAGSRDRATSTAERHAARCDAWHAAHPSALGDPCREGGPHLLAIPVFKNAQNDIKSAQAMLAGGNVEWSAAYLDRALDTAMRLDGEGTVIASLTAASIVNSVLDFLQKEKAMFGRERIATLLEGRRLVSAKRPLEGERLAIHRYIAEMPGKLPVPTGPFGRMFAAYLIDQRDARLDNMEGAILRRDPEACKRAGEGDGMAPVLCDKLVDVVKAESRLELVRSSVRPSRRG